MGMHPRLDNIVELTDDVSDETVDAQFPALTWRS
jgi:hypothetical protein